MQSDVCPNFRLFLRMLQRTFTIGLAMMIYIMLPAQEIQYVQTKPEAGDGVLSMLRRYQMEAWSCNVEQFYLINKMEKTDGLQRDKTYNLPIRKHRYNGKNIRSTIGIQDFNQAVRIQDYNRAMEKARLKSRAYEEDLELWVPYHILNCIDEADSTRLIADDQVRTAKSGQYTIFGEKYKSVAKVSETLKGQVFYIKSGHGGPDPGAMATRDNHQLCEDEYAYDVALRLCRYLISHGAIAYMIVRDNNDGIRDETFLMCDTDEVVLGDKPIPLNQKERLYQRARIINELFQRHKKQGVKKQTVICIHVDSNSKSKRQDVFFYHASKSPAGKIIATTMHETFREKYQAHQAGRVYHGTVSARDLYILRETSPVGVYIELANIRNPDDQKRIIHKENRDALAKWMADGLIKASK